MHSVSTCSLLWLIDWLLVILVHYCQLTLWFYALSIKKLADCWGNFLCFRKIQWKDMIQKESFLRPEADFQIGQGTIITEEGITQTLILVIIFPTPVGVFIWKGATLSDMQTASSHHILKTTTEGRPVFAIDHHCKNDMTCHIIIIVLFLKTLRELYGIFRECLNQQKAQVPAKQKLSPIPASVDLLGCIHQIVWQSLVFIGEQQLKTFLNISKHTAKSTVYTSSMATEYLASHTGPMRLFILSIHKMQPGPVRN